jgi:hypothetical protein
VRRGENNTKKQTKEAMKTNETEVKEIEINGILYVQKSLAKQTEPLSDAVIVRCESAGAFFGYIKNLNLPNGVAELTNARRLWYWSGAASLSQLAVEGTKKPNECKFPVAVQSIMLSKVIEVIPCTAEAAKSITGVSIWKQ